MYIYSGVNKVEGVAIQMTLSIECIITEAKSVFRMGLMPQHKINKVIYTVVLRSFRDM